ncbi:GntR family transcriptional regulator [Roseomonas sp. BN140053]|uniref:GntR family transcriptional regulator n=1 Tax=Roseomonas sp. BN140053 TaxID=3391898 RepID=UPI0039ECA9B2
MELRIPAAVTVQAQAVSTLREAILSGHFQPGQRLVETELCGTLGISRPSLREALRRLEGERLVSIVPNRGPSVAEITWTQAEQIYGLRALLEGEAAAAAATAATPAQLAAMREALAAFDAAAAAGDAAGRVSATTRFFDALLAAAGNAVIEEVLRGLLARINLLRGRSMSRAGRARESAAEMRVILDAVARRDAAAARAAAAAHVAAARDAAHAVMLSLAAA